MKKREVSEATKKKLRENLAKARAKKSALAAAKRQFKDGDRQKIIDGSNVLKDILMVISLSYADGRISKEGCLACEGKYVPGNNGCPCQSGWQFVGQVEEYLKDAV